MLGETTRSELINNLAEHLKAHYVFPDGAERICSHLQERTNSCAYREITEGEQLAAMLTEDIQYAK